jgi:hypothetical protein
MSIVGLIVFLVIVGLLLWVARTLSAAFGIGPPILPLLYVVIVVFAVLWLLQSLGALSGGPVVRLN